MGLKKGLDSIKKHIDAEEAKFSGSGDRPKTKWFVLFLQELDVDATNYSQKNGIGFIAVEHSNPKDFKRKAVCTADDEGVCWACEQHDKDWKAGWKQKNRLYINVLVDDGSNEPYVAVLSQGTSDSQITPALIEYATDTETITDKWYKIKRNGIGFNDTSYLLMPGAVSKENVEDYELFDLDKVVYNVPYEKQEAHYLDGQAVDEPAEEEKVLATAGAGTNDSEW
jgi:hypothetical protein